MAPKKEKKIEYPIWKSFEVTFKCVFKYHYPNFVAIELQLLVL